MEERLQKILARAGYGSRRACEILIEQGRVTVNGRRAELGQKANPDADRVEVDGEPLPQAQRLRYVALHKPAGIVSSLAAQGERQTVRDLVPLPERLYPVGRLDVESEGLILLTNDGELTDYLTHPRYESEKEYRVLVRGTPDEERLRTWRRGVVLEGRKTLPAEVRREEKSGDNTWLRVVMREGRKHQVRDIGRALGLPVLRLIRVRMGSLELGSLRPGEWRELARAEVAALRPPTGAAPGARKGRVRPAARRPASGARPGDGRGRAGSDRPGTGRGGQQAPRSRPPGRARRAPRR
jgi:23S rRNA pseudouridine2605 synthase